MHDRRPLRLALLGALAGLVTWTISEPFARTAANHGVSVGSTTFSIGSFFGWFAHAMLGATIVGFIAFSISLERMRLSRAVLWGLVATALGGFLGWASDAGSDRLCIELLRRGAIPSVAAGAIWNLAVALSLAAGIALCAQPTPSRVGRIMAGGLAAAVAAFIARTTIAPLTIIGALVTGRGGGWQPYDPGRLADHVTMGLVLGLCVGLGETVLTAARIRLVAGRNEGRDFYLGRGANRIGSAEGIEVPLFGDPSVAPVHAQIWPQDGRWLIQDAGTSAGTFVNGQPIGQAWLMGGEAVQIGSFNLQFLLKGQVASAPVFHAAPARAPVTIVPAVPVHRLVDPFGQITDLRIGATTVGRDPQSDFPLPHDGLVSRSHARIVVADDRATVEDLGSRNGTSLNGRLLQGPTELAVGDSIKVGGTELVYRRG